MKNKERNKKKLDVKRVIRNNAYMLGVIMKTCPSVPIISLLVSVMGALNAFFSIRTFLNTLLMRCRMAKNSKASF